jgi:hypothetical protein
VASPYNTLHSSYDHRIPTRRVNMAAKKRKKAAKKAGKKGGKKRKAKKK